MLEVQKNVNLTTLTCNESSAVLEIKLPSPPPLTVEKTNVIIMFCLFGESYAAGGSDRCVWNNREMVLSWGKPNKPKKSCRNAVSSHKSCKIESPPE
jgi:hypothetical protein